MSPQERFEENINLAYEIAHKNIRKMEMQELKDDMIQEALYGLWVACLRFDENRDVKFSTYAYSMCLGHIFKSNMGNHTRLERLKIKRNNLNVTKVSTENTVPGGDEETTIGDLLESQPLDERYDDMICFVNDFELFKETLTEREKRVIELREQLLSQAEIGRKMGLHQAQISRVMIKIREKYTKWGNRGK